MDRDHDSFVTPKYEHVPLEELRRGVYEIYRHLGDWLSTKGELDLERRYLRIGAERAHQNVSFSEVAWVIVLVKINLWEFLNKHAVEEPLVDVDSLVEVFQLLHRFFDHAITTPRLGMSNRRRTIRRPPNITFTAPKKS